MPIFQIRIYEATKKEVRELFYALEMTTTAAIILFSKSVILELVLSFTTRIEVDKNQFDKILFNKMFQRNKKTFEDVVKM